MNGIVSVLNLVLLVVVVVLLVVLWLQQRRTSGPAEIEPHLAALDASVAQLSRQLRDESSASRGEAAVQQGQLRQEVTTSLQEQIRSLAEQNNKSFSALRESVETRLSSFAADTVQKLDLLQQQSQRSALDSREETGKTLNNFNDSMTRSLTAMSEQQNKAFEDVRATLDARFAEIRAENEKKLEQMRQTVDEKLQSTLEARLGESFKQVSERLEQVHQGLGEMKNLATDVGDLQRIFKNVKTRGTWGEFQLGSLLEQMLAPDQYASNVATAGTNDRVEFAIRLPGDGESSGVVWLPIDAKFPIEDYRRLVDAAERADVGAVEEAAKQLESVLKKSAKDIRDKYIKPPLTTDFAILYLPTEGLYAEALRRPGLTETLQRDYRVVLASPTTLSAILNSLQMGFRTLAIQKRSSEVWSVLGAVKKQFGEFGDTLEKVKKKLDEAGGKIDEATRKTRTIQSKLKAVESTGALLGQENPEQETAPLSLSAAAGQVEDPDTE